MADSSILLKEEIDIEQNHEQVAPIVRDKIKGSDEVFEMHCEVCRRDGTVIAAVAFCTNCFTYLCGTCLKYHGKFLPDHTYLEKDKLPLDVCREVCEEHCNEFIKFYCSTCRVFACLMCKTKENKVTCSLEYVPELAKGIDDGKELQKIAVETEKLSARLEEKQKSIDEEYRHHDGISEEIRNAIQVERDSAFADFVEESKKMENTWEFKKRHDKQPLQTIDKKVNNLKEEIKNLTKKAKGLKESNRNQVYKILISMKQKENTLKELEDSASKVQLNQNSTLSSGEVRLLADEMKQRLGLFGIKTRQLARLELQKTKSATLETTIDIGVNGEGCQAYIVDCCLLSERFLVASDSINNIMLIDLITRNVVFTKMLYAVVDGITKISDNEISIISEYHHDTCRSIVQFLSLKSRKLFFQKRSFKKNIYCRAIASISHKRLLVLGGDIVQILDMTGRIITSIGTDGEGDRLFSDIQYVTVDSEGKRAYVNGFGNSGITGIDLENQKSQKLAPKIRFPSGLAIDNQGLIYVFEQGTGRVLLVQSDRQNSEVLIDSETGECQSTPLCYCPKNDKLYVCNGTVIRVYKVRKSLLAEKGYLKKSI